MPVAGIRTAMVSTVSLTAIDWITNQSCSRLASFLMASHRPGDAGEASLGFDRSDMAVSREGRYAPVWESEQRFTMTPGLVIQPASARSPLQTL